MCDRCWPEPEQDNSEEFTFCEICTARGVEKLRGHVDAGRMTEENFACLSSKPVYTEHKQAHSTMIDACVDASMIKIVEWFNSIGIPTVASCEDWVPDKIPNTPHIYVWKPVEFVREKIVAADPEMERWVSYQARKAMSVEQPEVDATNMFFLGGLPPQFKVD